MTQPANDAEALRDAFSSSIEIAGDGNDCPSAEALWESAHGQLGAQDEEGILMHVGECPACATAWRVARDLAADSPGKKVRKRSGWLPMAAAAAIGFLLIGFGYVMWTGRSDIAPVYRAGGGEWLQSQVPEEEVLPRDRCLLRWTAGPEGTVYQLRVTDERLDVLARGRGLEEAQYLVPEEALLDLPPGSRIVWQVTARLPDGTTVDSTSFISRIE